MKTLFETPDSFNEGYLPSMPSNILGTIMQAIFEQNWGAGLGMSAWQCPNGHIYFVGDCGRAVAGGKCAECGAPIGGKGYNQPGLLSFSLSLSLFFCVSFLAFLCFYYIFLYDIVYNYV